MLAASVFVCADVHAATWFWFSNYQSDTSLIFFDRDSVTRDHNVVTLWTDWVYSNEYAPSEGVQSEKNKVSIDCRMRTRKLLVSITYDKDGKVIDSFEHTAKSIDVVPDSVGEKLFKVVCSSGFPKKPSVALYFEVWKNDPIGLAAAMFESMRRAKADPAAE